MKIDQISSAAGSNHNEDLIAVYEKDGFTDIVIMDGGSSVADRNFIDKDIGDVPWLTTNFSRLLELTISRDRSQGESVSLAINDLHDLFREKTQGISVPLYAYPIAAMTWIRVTETAKSVTLKIYCLGDCKAFLLSTDKSVVDLDPYVNPQEQVLRDEILRLSQEGVTDATARKARLMPMLRARREFLNSAESPSVLCLKPNARFNAREYTVQTDPNSMLLAMTDGFYRIVDTYQIHTIEKLADLCLQGCLESILTELRHFEKGSSDSAAISVKAADDASAVTCRSGSAFNMLHQDSYSETYFADDSGSILRSLRARSNSGVRITLEHTL